MRPKHLNLIASAALLLLSSKASAHISYGSGSTGRDFGTIVPGGAAVTISNQTVTSNFGWADGTDADHGDSHKLRYYRFNVATAGYFTITFSGSTNGGAQNGTLKPAFSLYRGLAHLAPITNAPGSPDYDTSAITLAYLATLGYPTEGSFHALKTWRIGGENQTGPAFDFDAPDGLSTFTYVTHIADGDATLFGSAVGVVGDGNADGTVTKSLYLTAGDYTIAVGGSNYAGQAPVPDAATYGLVGAVSAASGDPAEGGIGYQYQVTLGNKSTAGFSGKVGAWSWEDTELPSGLGWTHSSDWLALRLTEDTNVTVTMNPDANVPDPSPEEPDRKADTTSMKPSFSIWKNWDNDGDDFHTYQNSTNVDWAEDLQYVTHVNNSSAPTVTRTYFLRAGDYTLALGSNATANNTREQGYSINLTTTSVNRIDPVPAAGGIGYTYTVVAGAGETGSFSSHVGAWSWEDNDLFGQPGQSTQPVGWTHTSNWMALKLTQDVFFSLTMERDANVPWTSPSAPPALNGMADTVSMFPSLTLYRGWDNDGTDLHTYNNRGNISWAEDLRYVDHLDNSTSKRITRTWRLPAGEYSLALGSNASTSNGNRQGYKATFSTKAAGDVVAGDAASGGIGYAHVISVGRGDSGNFSDGVGAWSWEDGTLFGGQNQGTDPVGWTHASNWVAVHVKDHVMLNITMAPDANVPWASAPESLNGKADTASMAPSFTLWRGWDNDDTPDDFKTRADIVAAWAPYGGVPADLGDHHTYNNHGNVDWAEDLTYLDHYNNSKVGAITRSYTLAPGYYTFVLGSNSSTENGNLQGFKFSWTTSTAALVGPVITQQPKAAETLVGKGASFSIKATGPTLTYQWFHKGQPITGATSATCTLKTVTVDHAGVYTCTARNNAGWATSQAALLTVIAKPVVAPFDIDDLIVGQPVQFQLVASSNPTAFSVKGLPKGLVFNAKTGLISGWPAEIKATFTVEVIASNKAGNSDKVTDTLAVTALPVGLASTYTAPLNRSATLNNLLGGCVKLQLTNLGSLSGTITLGNAAALRVAAPIDTSLQSPTASFQILRKDLPTLQVMLVLDFPTKNIFGQISDGSETLPFVAVQPIATLGTHPGDYTTALKLQSVDVGDQSIPQGHSVGAFTIAASGATSGVLLMADNTKVTFAGGLEKDGGLTLFSPLYKGEGSVLGLLRIHATSGDVSSSELSWFKGEISKDLVYRAGFGPVDLSLIGRKYVIPAAGDLAGLHAALSFTQGGAPDPAARLYTEAITVNSATSFTIGTPNPGKIKGSMDLGKAGKFVAGTTGSFKGSFELTDSDTSVTPNKNLVRKADFQGMFVDDGEDVKGYGFFLLSKMPTASPKTTLATSPKLSGAVALETFLPVAP
ncbi:MAG: immunoglobulin domain-containing protein [Verrucomicrobiota bacterium]